MPALEGSPAYLCALAEIQQTAGLTDCPFRERAGVSAKAAVGLPKLLSWESAERHASDFCFDRAFAGPEPTVAGDNRAWSGRRGAVGVAALSQRLTSDPACRLRHSLDEEEVDRCQPVRPLLLPRSSR